MPDAFKVLVFPAGELNSAELHEALSRQVNIDLFGATSIERLGHHLFKRYRNDLPLISDVGFLTSFNKLLKEWAIDLIIPSHDSVVEYLSDNRDHIGCRALLPSSETARICRDKRLTYDAFSGEKFTPKRYQSIDEVGCEIVFAKPAKGQGAVGARIVGPMQRAAIDWQHEVVCEYLPGDEVTVDCFTDRKGDLLGVFPRSRDRTLGGISVASRALLASKDIREIAVAVNLRLDFLGMWFIQLKKDARDGWKMLEVSARCPGGQCLTRARGVNLPLLSVYAAMGLDVTLGENFVRLKMDRKLTAMYDFEYSFETVYIDYDDTLVHPDGVDSEVIALLYQFKREGKRLILITRHEGDLRRSLEKNHIHPGLFERIEQLTGGTPKYKAMDRGAAIFIDNSHAERMTARIHMGIPAFDVEGIEVLKKWQR